MNDILETVQYKIDKIEERLPGVMDWQPGPGEWTVECKDENYFLFYDSKDDEYRERLIWDLTAELLYWYGMQEMLLETV
jgi:hypothetical protein